MTEFEEFLPGHPDEIFVTYQNMRIFYKFKERWQQWFALVAVIDWEATAGYPVLGSNWFETKEECIEWGKHLIDASRQRTS